MRSQQDTAKIPTLADGSRVIATAGGLDEPQETFNPLCAVEYRWSWLRRRYGNGQRAPWSFRLVVYGAKTRWMWGGESHPDEQLAEEKARVRFCPNCQLPIYPGEPVTEYLLAGGLVGQVTETRLLGREPHVVEGEPSYVVGCMRMGCNRFGIGSACAIWDGETLSPINWRAAAVEVVE